MQMNDSQRIEAPIETVWAALNDPDVLKACIPGCEELIKHSDTELEAKVKLKVGPVKATFGGKVELKDLNPPNGYTIEGEGSGGVAGFARGGAKVALEADGADATILTYDVDAKVGGKLAQLGDRLLASCRQVEQDVDSLAPPHVVVRCQALAWRSSDGPWCCHEPGRSPARWW